MAPAASAPLRRGPPLRLQRRSCSASGKGSAAARLPTGVLLSAATCCVLYLGRLAAKLGTHRTKAVPQPPGHRGAIGLLDCNRLLQDAACNGTCGRSASGGRLAASEAMGLGPRLLALQRLPGGHVHAAVLWPQAIAHWRLLRGRLVRLNSCSSASCMGLPALLGRRSCLPSAAAWQWQR